MFELDPDKPDIPALARIQLWMGVVCMIASVISLLLAFSGYEFINEGFAFAGAIGAFLVALLFVGQAKTLELQAIISARVKSRFAMEGVGRSAAAMSGNAALGTERKAAIIPQKQTERVIKIPDQDVRAQGLGLK